MSDPSLRRPRSDSGSDLERPNRRQRVGDIPGPAVLDRDTLFYKEGGDCYLRAEDHLFKIHRYHLTRGDASVFHDMFLLPSGDNPSQGSSESDPIVLAGDTAERFRGFLSIAYAEPLEFQVTETQPNQLPTFIHCAHFAHKYNITPPLLGGSEGYPLYNRQQTCTRFEDIHLAFRTHQLVRSRHE
ncbi:hypothetical protein C8R44DRAFT_194132 [Mycena epipterygia]|nr:hypothetical protein C8R44DRAFT_194132 [Mycena epipterygia]